MAKNAQIEGGAGGGFGTANDTSERGRKVKAYVDSRNTQRVQPMIRSQMVALEGGTTCYIYNVSPIFEWRRTYKGLGVFLIPRRPKVGDVIKETIDGKLVERVISEEDIKGKYRVSPPVVIQHAYRQSYDKGDNRRVPYVEFGEEIAESLVGNSKIYPADLAHPANNLENWGVFITYGHPLHELPESAQDELYTQALTVHQKRCYEKIAKADTLIDRFPDSVLEIHRQCALFVGEDRKWVTDRGKPKGLGTTECPFCGSQIKTTVVKCPQCQEIVDPVRYQAMKKS